MIALNPGVRTVAAVSRRSPLTLSIQPAYVELLSWNDFGESHYLGPVRASAGVPSGATAYADTKHDHLPMLWLSAYYNIWYASVPGCLKLKLNASVLQVQVWLTPAHLD